MKITSNKIFLIFLILVFYFSSCGSGINDVSEQICGEYTYRVDGGHIYIVPSNFFKDIVYSQVVDYSCDSNYILIHQKPSKKYTKIYLSEQLNIQYTLIEDTIPINKISNIYDFKDFDSVLYIKIKGKFKKDNSIETQSFFNTIADSIILHNSKYKKLFLLKDAYWIINIKNENVFGPYTFIEFIERKDEIGVSKKLQFKK